jgi:2-methylisocitrate lyase-like PEP mutase family enzyme
LLEWVRTAKYANENVTKNAGHVDWCANPTCDPPRMRLREALQIVHSQLSVLAEDLRRRHFAGEPLVLPNAWDPSSARAVARAGFAAVATAAGAREAARGLGDGLPRPEADDLFAAWACIAQAVAVPVSAEVEPSFGLGPEEWAERLFDAGVVGVTVPESASGMPLDAATKARWVRRLREEADRARIHLVINARVDVERAAAGRHPLREALARAAAYLANGADCVYPAGIEDEGQIAAFVDALRAPVQIAVRPGVPPLGRLTELGVRRVVFGDTRRPASGIARALERVSAAV